MEGGSSNNYPAEETYFFGESWNLLVHKTHNAQTQPRATDKIDAVLYMLASTYYYFDAGLLIPGKSADQIVDEEKHRKVSDWVQPDFAAYVQVATHNNTTHTRVDTLMGRSFSFFACLSL